MTNLANKSKGENTIFISGEGLFSEILTRLVVMGQETKLLNDIKNGSPFWSEVNSLETSLD
mgnify:CR=1 FL=1